MNLVDKYGGKLITVFLIAICVLFAIATLVPGATPYAIIGALVLIAGVQIHVKSRQPAKHNCPSCERLGHRTKPWELKNGQT